MFHNTFSKQIVKLRKGINRQIKRHHLKVFDSTQHDSTITSKSLTKGDIELKFKVNTI